VPLLEQQVAAQENLLSVLLGRVPGPIERGLALDALKVPQIPPGLPASLLERRPDVLQAEQNLVAANAEVGVAKSLYFPSISLTGALGSTSAALSNFLSGPAAVAMIAAQVAGPIFTFGNIEGQVRSAEAAKTEAVANYRLAVLEALRDTNDALTGTEKLATSLEAQVARVKALRDYARLSRLKYDSGVSSYTDVLYAENELFSAELTTVGSESDRLIQLVAVYRALGGGWVDALDPAASNTSGKE
jgi:multidrug efflux system outer membrane protein